jgi:hypothetical protein
LKNINWGDFKEGNNFLNFEKMVGAIIKEDQLGYKLYKEIYDVWVVTPLLKDTNDQKFILGISEFISKMPALYPNPQNPNNPDFKAFSSFFQTVFSLIKILLRANSTQSISPHLRPS